MPHYPYSVPLLPINSVQVKMKQTVFTIQLIPCIFGYVRIQRGPHLGKLSSFKSEFNRIHIQVGTVHREN